jgi:dipeptidyl aminopeptidase/acylaminoacyl peptidase
MTEAMIRRAFSIAEVQGGFHVNDVSPIEAARRIRIPVLLIHGRQDADTPIAHSERVLNALAGPKDLLRVQGARHNESLRSADTWQRIDQWVDEVVRGR